MVERPARNLRIDRKRESERVKESKRLREERWDVEREGVRERE